MSKRGQASRLSLLTLLILFSAEACGTVPSPGASPTAEYATEAAPAATLDATMPALSVPTGMPLPISMPTLTTAPARVIITATNGNVFIRRGPDFAFDSVGALMQGQSATALARDVLAEWVEIPLPQAATETGWISIQSRFTAIDGDVHSLPEVEPDYFPVGASIRNCTFHQMLLSPGNIILPSVLNFPYNDVRVNPGVYVVVDSDVDSYPSVAKVEVREGSAIEIRVDGNGNKRKCPVP